VPACIAALAFATSFVSGFYCQTIQFAPLSGTGGVELQMGPWYARGEVQVSTAGGYYVTNYVCTSLPTGTVVDSKLKTVRAFTIISPLFGGFLTIGLWLAICFGRGIPTPTWNCWAGLFLVMMPLYQGLTFLILDSSFCLNNTALASTGLYSGECQWGQGSTANVISVILWFFTGVSMLVLGAPPSRRPDPNGPAETQTVTYERTENKDGTASIQQVAVVKGTTVPVPPSATQQSSPPLPVEYPEQPEKV